MQLVAGN